MEDKTRVNDFDLNRRLCFFSTRRVDGGEEEEEVVGILVLGGEVRLGFWVGEKVGRGEG